MFIFYSQAGFDIRNMTVRLYLIFSGAQKISTDMHLLKWPTMSTDLTLGADEDVGNKEQSTIVVVESEGLCSLREFGSFLYN